jgi:hypothetical protein
VKKEMRFKAKWQREKNIVDNIQNEKIKIENFKTSSRTSRTKWRLWKSS